MGSQSGTDQGTAHQGRATLSHTVCQLVEKKNTLELENIFTHKAV